MDLFLESIKTLASGIILFVIVSVSRHQPPAIRKGSGWRFIVSGFTLIFMGSVLDITDNFPSLSTFIVIGDTVPQAILEKIVGYACGGVCLAIGFGKWLPHVIAHHKLLSEQLERAQKEAEKLEGLLPICSCCKKIKDNQGNWNSIENYVSKRSEATFSHGYCPQCMEHMATGISGRDPDSVVD